MIYYDGQYDERLLKKERLSKVEVLQAVRREGLASLESVSAIILETDGTLSIINKEINQSEDLSSLSNIERKE